MIVTHCGSAVVASEEDQVGRRVQTLGRRHGIKIEITHDGMELVLR